MCSTAALTFHRRTLVYEAVPPFVIKDLQGSLGAFASTERDASMPYFNDLECDFGQVCAVVYLRPLPTSSVPWRMAHCSSTARQARPSWGWRCRTEILRRPFVRPYNTFRNTTDGRILKISSNRESSSGKDRVRDRGGLRVSLSCILHCSTV